MSIGRVGAWLTACMALAVAIWLSLLAARLAPDAAQYERAPDCPGLGSNVVSECVTWAPANATTLSVEDYGLVVISHVEVRTNAQILVGDVVGLRWSNFSRQRRQTGVALSWRGRLTALRVSGRIEHTLQNPYLARLWATILSASLIFVGGGASVICFYRWDPPLATRVSQPSTDLVGAGVFLVAALSASYVSDSLLRIALVAAGWLGLGVFLVLTGKQTYMTGVEFFQRRSLYGRQYMLKAGAMAVIGLMGLAVVIIMAFGMTRSALA